MTTYEWRLATERERRDKRCQAGYCDHSITQAETVAVEHSPQSRGPGFLHTYYFCDHHADVARECTMDAAEAQRIARALGQEGK